MPKVIHTGYLNVRGDNGEYIPQNTVAEHSKVFVGLPADVPISELVNGMLIFDTSVQKLKIYYNNTWIVVGP